VQEYFQLTKSQHDELISQNENISFPKIPQQSKFWLIYTHVRSTAAATPLN